MKKIPVELEKAIEKEDLIIFAGAGLSRQFNFPDWKVLVQNIIEKLNDKEPEAVSMLPAIEKGWMSPILALDQLKKYKTEIYKEISSCFKLNGNEDFSRHRELLKLSSKIITTNFDKSFETADSTLDMIPYRSSFKISQLQGKEKYLFKIHGCIEYPEDCILFSDQYDEHYSETNTSIFELKKLISDNTILFIGFSLSDPFVKSVFNFISSIYNGHSRKHFIITTDTNLEKEINISTISCLLIDNYQIDFDSTIQQLLSLKKETSSELTLLENKPETNLSNPTICILCPSPIEKEIEYNLEEIANVFNCYDAVIDLEYFSIENLRELKPFDYVLIFTYALKNKMLCEDEFLKSKYISINEIEDNIDQRNIKFISVFYYGDNLTITNSVKLPHILVNTEKGKFKEILRSFIYKVFKKSDKSDIIRSFECCNFDFEIKPLNSTKGKSIKNIHKPIISRYIDQKLLTKFIGRKTDLENIIRKIIENQFNNTLLTIKGSGGIGKTTIICKAAIELANRKYFPNGIHFISCQSINTIENFYYHISHCFNLINSSELKDQIIENNYNKSRLIILDNFETLLNIQDKPKILDLVSFILDYSTVIITSRQILDLEFEDVYELRNFTTDEGVQLFKSYYQNVKPEEEKILREQIIERILNNNPLAIKLIAKGLVNSKNLFQLKEELEENIFKDDNLEKIFEKPEDYNIEKSNSLYQSINYSYRSLSDKEKLTFELLSLFPDGIHLENFKKFISQSKKNKLFIGDKEIKSLDNKSLLENSNAFLKLQSIISRFADYHFSLKVASIKKDFYTIAYDYNRFFLSFLNSNLIEQNIALRILDGNTNNYLKIIDNIEFVDIIKEEKIVFVDDVISVFRSTNQYNEIFKRSKQIYSYFNDLVDAELYIDTMFIFLEYWTTNFNKPFDDLKQKIPLSSLSNKSYENKIKKETAYNALSIYGFEGYQAEVVKHRLEVPECELLIHDHLFQLGYIEEVYNSKRKTQKSFLFIFENKAFHQDLTLNEVDKYINSCHPKDTLEIIQISYLKLKYFGSISKSEIKKMVVTNPYTKGIIVLMTAIIEKDDQKKKDYYIKAINLLINIKYYHIEAIINFCQYLKIANDSAYNEWLTKGLMLAEKYKFRYLFHQLKDLENEVVTEYFQENYEQIVPIESIIKYLNKK